jgi:hypothetical protein
MRSSAARELADVGIELALARDWAEKAVQQTHEENARLELPDGRVTVTDAVARMAYYFETLGHVLLAQGEHDQAWEYCMASWRLTLRPRAADCLSKAANERGDDTSTAIFAAQARLPRINMTPRAPGDLSVTRYEPDFRQKFADEIRVQISRTSRTLSRPANIPAQTVVRLMALIGRDGRVMDFRFADPPPSPDVADTVGSLIRGLEAAPAMPDRGAARFIRSGSFACEGSSGACRFVLSIP